MKKFFSFAVAALVAGTSFIATAATQNEFYSDVTYTFNGETSNEVKVLSELGVYFTSSSSKFSYLQEVKTADEIKVVDAEGNTVAEGIYVKGESNYVLTAKLISFQGVPAGSYNIVIPAGMFGFQIYGGSDWTSAGAPYYGYNDELTVAVTVTEGEEPVNYAYTVDPADGSVLESLSAVNIKFDEYPIAMQSTGKVIAIDANGDTIKAPTPTMTMAGNYIKFNFEKEITTPGKVTVKIPYGTVALHKTFGDGANIDNQKIVLTYQIGAETPAAEPLIAGYYDDSSAFFGFYTSDGQRNPLTVEINEHSVVYLLDEDGNPVFEAAELKYTENVMAVTSWKRYENTAEPLAASRAKASDDVDNATFAIADITVGGNYIDYTTVSAMYTELTSASIAELFPAEIKFEATVNDEVAVEDVVNEWGDTHKNLTVTIDVTAAEGVEYTAYFEGGLGGLYTADYMNSITVRNGENTITFVDAANQLKFGENALDYKMVITDAEGNEVAVKEGTLTVTIPVPTPQIGESSLVQGEDYVNEWGDSYKTVVLTINAVVAEGAEYTAYFTEGLGGLYMDGWQTSAPLVNGENTYTFIDRMGTLVPGNNDLAFNLVIVENTTGTEVYTILNGILSVNIAEDVVGINAINAASNDVKAYDLQGRAVKNAKGLVIMNGVKTYVK